jgi:hypothetical protein
LGTSEERKTQWVTNTTNVPPPEPNAPKLHGDDEASKKEKFSKLSLDTKQDL